MTFEDAVWIGLGIRLPEPEPTVNPYQQIEDAEAAAKILLARYHSDQFPSQDVSMAAWSVMDNRSKESGADVVTLRAYYAEHGVSALLRIFANAMEPTRA